MPTTAISSTYIIRSWPLPTFLQASRRPGNTFVQYSPIAVAGGARGGPARWRIFFVGSDGVDNGTSAGNCGGDRIADDFPRQEGSAIRPQTIGQYRASARRARHLLPPIMGAGAFFMSVNHRHPLCGDRDPPINPALLFLRLDLFQLDLAAQKSRDEGHAPFGTARFGILARSVSSFPADRHPDGALFMGYSVMSGHAGHCRRGGVSC